MPKKFNPIRFTKLAKVLKKVMSVFYIVSIVALVGFIIMAVFCVTLPDEYFNIAHFRNGSFSLEMNGMLKYDLSISKLPADTNFRKIFISIAGTAFIYALALMRIFKLSRDLLMTVAQGVPFDKENPMRLVNIASVVIGGAFLFPALNELVVGRMIDIFLLNGFSLKYSADLFLLLAGLMLLIMAGVFRYGCYLQNEYDETL